LANLDEDLLAQNAPRSVLWRNRDFLLLWSGQTISTLGTRVSGLALPLLVLALTHSPAQAGLIATVNALPYLVLSLPAGALIDRWNRKSVMIRCDLVRFLALGSIPLAQVSHHLSIAQLYAASLVEGTAYVFFNIAQIAALPRVVPTTQLPQATAVNATAESTASLIGPGLGGIIISTARTTESGAVLAYLIDSVSYLASVLSLSAIRTPFQVERQPNVHRSLRAEIMEGLRFLWKERRVRTMACLTMSINLLSSPMYLAIIILARNQMHANASTIGLIFSVASGAGLLGSLIAPWIKAHLRFGQIIIGVIVLQALALPLLATAVSPIMLIIGWALVTLTIPIYNVTQVSYRLSLIPDILQGRVNSAFRLLAFGGVPIGTAIGGLLLGPLGPRTELWLVAAGLGLTALAASFTDVRKA